MSSGAFAAATSVALSALLLALDVAVAQPTGRSDVRTVETLPAMKGTYGRFITHDDPVPLPGVSFLDERGIVTTMDQFRGKLVLLNLWGTWCPPCVEEMPSLDRLQDHFERERFEVVAVCNECGEVDSIRTFFGEHGLSSLSIYHRPGYEMAVTLGVRGMPTSILVDREGRELGRLSGDAEWDSPDAITLIRHYLELPR